MATCSREAMIQPERLLSKPAERKSKSEIVEPIINSEVDASFIASNSAKPTQIDSITKTDAPKILIYFPLALSKLRELPQLL